MLMNHLIQSLESRTLMSVSLKADGAENPTLPKPTELKAVVAGLNVTLNWKDNSTDETGFAIFRRVGNTITLLTKVDANVTTFTDNNAPAGQDQYMVRALKGDTFSSGSNIAVAKVEPVIAVTAPNKLRSRAVSTTQIALEWEGDRGAKGGYIIERSADGKEGWTQVGTTAANVRKFTDTGLSAGTRYYYRITAIGADGSKAVSVVLIGQTKVTDKPEKK
jgi:titin